MKSSLGDDGHQEKRKKRRLKDKLNQMNDKYNHTKTEQGELISNKFQKSGVEPREEEQN